MSSVSRLPVLPATGNAVVKNTFSTTFGTCGFQGKKNKQEKSVNWLESNFYCSNSKQLSLYIYIFQRDTGKGGSRYCFSCPKLGITSPALSAGKLSLWVWQFNDWILKTLLCVLPLPVPAALHSYPPTAESPILSKRKLLFQLSRFTGKTHSLFRKNSFHYHSKLGRDYKNT